VGAYLNPAARRRELARRLRQLREQHGFTVEQVADLLICSSPKISRIETGARRASLRDIRDLTTLYGVPPEEVARLLELARQARQAGWWTKYYDSSYALYVGLEQDAAAITSFSRYAIPALLQTSEYSRAVFESSRHLNDDDLERHVDGITRRQGLFVQQPMLRYTAFLDEAVLHRRAGDAQVMYAQLAKLLDIASPKVSVHILPFNAGLYSTMEGSFHLLDFDDASLQAPLLFIEGFFGNIIQDRSVGIELARQAVRDLRQVALSARRSSELVGDVMDSYKC